MSGSHRSHKKTIGYGRHYQSDRSDRSDSIKKLDYLIYSSWGCILSWLCWNLWNGCSKPAVASWSAWVGDWSIAVAPELLLPVPGNRATNPGFHDAQVRLPRSQGFGQLSNTQPQFLSWPVDTPDPYEYAKMDEDGNWDINDTLKWFKRAIAVLPCKVDP